MPLNYFAETTEERKEHLAAEEELRQEAEEKYAKRIAAALSAQIAEIEMLLTSGGDPEDFDEARLLALIETMNRQVAQAFADIAIESGTGAFALTPDEKREAKKGARERIAQYVALSIASRVSKMGDFTRRIVRGIVFEGNINDLAFAEMADQLRDWWKRNKKARVLSVAASEVVNASNFGSMSGFSSMSREVIKIWNTTPDGKARISHSIADGQPRRLDEPFDLQGGQLMQPGDGSLGIGPGELVNCRCGMTYEALNPEDLR